MFFKTRAGKRMFTFWPCALQRILIIALILGVICSTVTLRGPQRGLKPGGPTSNDSIFVSIGAYRDNECASTRLDMYRQAQRPENVFTGVVTYTFDETSSGAAGGVANVTKTAGGGDISSNHSLASERCESTELAPFERNIRRLSVRASSAKGPSLSRYQAATMYGGEQYLLQIDSHMRFTPGWDVELQRMIRDAPSRNAVLTHYPPSWDDMSERRVPAMCLARWVEEAAGQRVLMLEAALMDPLPRGRLLRPVPFAAAGFMFAPARVMEDVPFDPSLDYLFHGEEALYSARLWTHGWDMFTPDRNVAFHHYNRDGAPKFWNDFDANPSYHTRKAAVLRKVEALMLSEYGTGGFKYGMGRQRTVRQWWQYTGLEPSNRSQAMDVLRFCWVEDNDRHQHRHHQQQEIKETSTARHTAAPTSLRPPWWGRW